MKPSYSISHLSLLTNVYYPACKISGLKIAPICTDVDLQTVYIPVLLQIYVQYCAFWWKSFYMLIGEEEEKGLRISNQTLLLVILRWHGSERVNPYVCIITYIICHYVCVRMFRCVCVLECSSFAWYWWWLLLIFFFIRRSEYSVQKREWTTPTDHQPQNRLIPRIPLNHHHQNGGSNSSLQAQKTSGEWPKAFTADETENEDSKTEPKAPDQTGESEQKETQKCAQTPSAQTHHESGGCQTRDVGDFYERPRCGALERCEPHSSAIHPLHRQPALHNR